MSCPELEVLDFKPNYPCYNATNTTLCEEEWPCEIRLFWLQLHPFVDITRGFLSYGSLVIIVLGVILNSLSFSVLLSSGLAKNGSGIYLLTLAVCDSGNLLTNILIGIWRGWSLDFNEYFMENEWLCRSHGVFVEVFQTISAWIVVAFTVERSLAVWYPMTLRENRQYRAKVVVASLTTVFTLFCLSKLFITGFEKDSVFGYIPCNSGRLEWEGLAYVRVAIQTWIPTIIVFTFNCLMFWKLGKVKTNRKRLTAHVRDYVANKPIGPQKQTSFINKPSSTNPMLIAVSLAYLILVFPLGAVQTVELWWNVHSKVPVATEGLAGLDYIHWLKYKLLLKYIRSFFFGCYQINFAINFFLYFAAGVEFRRYLQKRTRSIFASCKVYLGLAEPTPKARNSRYLNSVSHTTSLSTLPPSSTSTLAMSSVKRAGSSKL